MTKEIETSKGKFEIIEMVGEENAMRLTCDIISGNVYYKLKEITEEELFEFSDLTYSILHFKNIKITPNTYIFKT